MMFRSLVLSCSLLGFLAGSSVIAMEDENSKKSTTIKAQTKNASPRELVQFDFERTFPLDMQKIIVQQVVYEQSLENKSPVNIALVCKKWRDLVKEEMKVNNPGWKAWYGIVGPEKEAIYQKFFNGKLVYRPQEGSDEGKIELRIADLKNPLGFTFDLSSCGAVGQDISINTGCRTVQTSVNANKVEMWLAPRFLVEKKLNTLPRNHHMREILKTWDSKYPVGIFWTWGGWNAAEHMEYCDYLTTESMTDISSENLLKKYQKSVCTWARMARTVERLRVFGTAKFHISFVN